MKRALTILLLLIALPSVGAWCGRLAAPALARQNYIVQVAERVWRAEQEKPGAEHEHEDDRLTAFRATGLPAARIYEQAREIQSRFRLGGALFGLWCGLVAALKIASLLAWRRGALYDADPSRCLACARCFASCPVGRDGDVAPEAAKDAQPAATEAAR